jgi:hypothetical protein
MGDCAFDHIKYADYYPDLKKAYQYNKHNLQIHYLRHGIKEKRTPCGDIQPDCNFEAQKYINNYPDWIAAYGTTKLGDATGQYHKYGIHENRIICKAKPPTPEQVAAATAATAEAEAAAEAAAAIENTKIDETQQEEVKTFFTKFLNEKINYANDQFGQVSKIVKNLLNLDVSNTNNLVTNINGENTLIDKKLEQNASRINRSSIVKWKYQEEDLNQLQYQNYILFIVFYVLVCALGVIMYFYSDSNMAVQVIVFHVLLVWPFVIYYSELIIYTIFKYIYAYSYGIPYDKVYFGDF